MRQGGLFGDTWKAIVARATAVMNIRKTISEYKIRLKSLNVLSRRSCHFVFFVAHVICTLHLLKKQNNSVCSAKQNQEIFLRAVLLFEVFVLEYLRNKFVDQV